MDRNRDPLGMGESNQPTYWYRDSSDEFPYAQAGRGGGYIKVLRVLAYLVAVGIAIFGIVTAALSRTGGAGAGFVMFLLSLLYALVVLVVTMVYVEMAANVKAIADNTASMKVQLDSLKKQLKESCPARDGE